MRIPKIPYWPFLLGPWLAFGIGFALNALVMAVNHGQMPVLTFDCDVNLARWVESGDYLHSCMVSTTHLKALADYIVIPGVGTASPGDFFEWASEWLGAWCLPVWIALVLKNHNE